MGKKHKAIRKHKIHSNATVATTKRKIADEYKVPLRSIRIVRPDGTQMKGNARVGTLCALWGEPH